MKQLLSILAAAALFGLAPASAAAQGIVPGTGAPPSDAISAASQADPAQPAEVSKPGIANPGDGGAPAIANIAQAAPELARATPTPGIGQPDGRLGVQDQFTPIGEEAAWFHNVILMPIITAISVFVLLLMLYVIVRYRRSAHPNPSRTTHNTLIEVIWTLVPVIILVAIAVPSIKLLANQYSPPKADLTVKVVGNQWYWTYSYPDNGDFEIVSNVLSDADAKARGEPRLLGVDERMVVPAGATVKLIVTSNDVIHSFGVPAFWTKMDAVPGRLNETWIKVDRPGLYYGNCFELCGVRHAFMPVAVEVVPPAQFAAWVASKGGTMPGARPAPVADSTAATTVSPTNVTAGAAPTPEAGNATGTQPVAGNGQAGVANRATDGTN